MGMRRGRTCKNVSTSCESPSKRSKNTENENSSENSLGASINVLPVEILLEIFSYLSSQDLYSLQRVSTFFEDIVRDPVVWRDYEVTNNSMNTSDVLQELKRMPFLKRIRIEARADSDDILRQVSLTNKNIEELHIINCTGSTAKLYLRSSHLIRILERCNRLHTINILGTRFRGLKFYRLLGSMGLRLRAAAAPATSTQFKTFAKHAHHIRAKDRKVISEWCRGVRNWMPLQYSVLEQVGGQACTALVSYLYDDFVSIDATSSCKAST
ncbi:uncharacterized protein LOC107265739 [Cephus cinctus]|uniref:Uncharacterized protein LOC107265739 n=1 Tax=Cephus cinctus TaxID=211228 RepID=A0AAJ7RDL9_CEPCN|nr:uncharacterized protein LOC107265739 [Cephus cinctus]XP_024938909.1 uncharacterized protein LOC107265739 [Cephus cinctus]